MIKIPTNGRRKNKKISSLPISYCIGHVQTVVDRLCASTELTCTAGLPTFFSCGATTYRQRQPLVFESQYQYPSILLTGTG